MENYPSALPGFFVMSLSTALRAIEHPSTTLRMYAGLLTSVIQEVEIEVEKIWYVL